MKRKKLLWLLPLAVILYACPFESKVPLASRPAEPVDTSLLGYWYGIIKDGSDYFGIEALEIDKKSDSVYTITRYGKSIKGSFISPDTAYFSGYTCWIGEQRFMNIVGTITTEVLRRKKAPEYRTENVYYLAAIKRSHDTLSVRTITDRFSPDQAFFNNTVELVETVTAMLKEKKNIYDEQYSLSYKKMQKTDHFK